MTLPFMPFIFGIGIGILGFLLLRPRSIQAAAHSVEKRREPDESFYTNPGEKCVICLLEMLVSDMHYLPCKHALHKQCYHKYVGKNALSCPLCRQRFR